MTLTQDEKDLLASIMEDKYAVGAFSGMVFNAVISNKDMTTEEVLKKALEVRLELRRLSK